MEGLLEARGLSYELVLVANYNAHEKETDQTPSVVQELAAHDPHIVVVSKPKEGMMGWDLNSGLRAATGETIAIIDGDGQMPAQDVIRIYDALRSGEYDAEMMIQASYLGFRVIEVPTVFHENKHRRSFVGVSAILEFLKNIVVYRLTRMHELRK